jgi:hypothetical protein
MGTNSFGNKSFMQPMRRLSMHLMRSEVYFFWGRWIVFPLVLNVFPMGLSKFSSCFPRVPNSTSGKKEIS